MSQQSSGHPSPTSGGSPAPAASESDWALILAIHAWADRRGSLPEVEQSASASQTVAERYASRLNLPWKEHLLASADRSGHTREAPGRPAAIDRLQTMHRQSARVDLARVHPTWWVRALKDESPAVQRIVAASVPDPMRGLLQNGLLLDSTDLAVDRAPAREVLGWVMALWTERLVGGEPTRPDDPPAMTALTALSPRAGYRLCRLAGLAKQVLADEASRDVRHPTRKRERERREWLRSRLADAGAELKALVRKDVHSSAGSGVPHRHLPARIGLTTLARLLADSEPFRLRWALQHWPYPIAKLLRLLMAQATSRPEWWLRGESLILQAAWERLGLEGYPIASNWQ